MLSDKQILFLRKQCHHLKPIVAVGNAGLTENVINELDLALTHHELVKVKISGGDRDERKAMVDTIIEKTGASLIQTIGHTASFYRPADKPVIILPKR